MPAIFSPYDFSNHRASTFVLPTSRTCSQNSTSALPCIIPWIGNTVAPESTSSLQLNNDRLVQAEPALRYWREHDNLYIWTPIPLFTERSDYRSLEMAIIQEWQPRLNYPFICQFFHPRKGILKKPTMNNNAQFGLATLWRRARHKFTPQLVRQVLTSERFQNRLGLWTIIHWVRTLRPDSNKPRCYGPTMEALSSAMLFDAWPTTSRNLTVHSP